MKPFLDTANLDEIRAALGKGWVRGITTNPSLMAKEPKSNFVLHIQKIADLCTQAGQLVPLSVEVFSNDPDEMYSQAREFFRTIRYSNLNIKIPVAWETLEVVRQLSKEEVKVNVTCGFNEAQGLLAAKAGAAYYSLFFCRIRDAGVDPVQTVQRTKKLLAGSDTELICGSIRKPEDVLEAFLAGADIVTAPLKVYEAMTEHFKTTEWTEKFLQDFKAWVS